MKNTKTLQILNFRFQILNFKNMRNPVSYLLIPIISTLIFLLFYLLLPTPYSPTSAHADVKNTKHNLSTSGPGPVKATTETRVCIFCHTPHGAVTTPLWNHSLSQASYTLPSSLLMEEWSTLLSHPQTPPDGDSRLCLSCHDGTIALGAIVNLSNAATTVTMQDSGTGHITPEGVLTSASPAYIGTELSGQHPVSIEVNLSLINDKNTQCGTNEVSFGLIFPQRPIKLTPTDNRYGIGPSTGVGVQCASCHDAHEDTIPYFLRVPSDGLFCESCHQLCP